MAKPEDDFSNSLCELSRYTEDEDLVENQRH